MAVNSWSQNETITINEEKDIGDLDVSHRDPALKVSFKKV